MRRSSSFKTLPSENQGTFVQTIKAYIYLLPALLILSVFVAYPLIMAFRMSMYENYNYYKDIGTGFGFASFKRVLSDPDFRLAMKNTLFLTFVATPVSLGISLFIAFLLHSIKRLQGFFQTIFFIPYVTSIIAVGIVFRWFFHSNYGLINYFLNLLEINPVAWLNNPKTSLYALAIYYVWTGLAFKIIIFLVGLQSIPRVYYNAARVDGAGGRRIFFRVTLPLLSPTILFLTVVSLIDAFKVYNQVYALFGNFGGPANSANTVVFYIYRTFYGAGRMHIAAAAAVILFIIILLITLLQLKISKKFVHYH
ncbi:MAG: sugar ABC transporter permease [Spirochaetales bacterium]|nr:sugar ABC transporter permease [Spirochaetales bacterium]